MTKIDFPSGDCSSSGLVHGWSDKVSWINGTQQPTRDLLQSFPKSDFLFPYYPPQSFLLFATKTSFKKYPNSERTTHIYFRKKKKGMDCGCGHIHWLLKPEVLSQILTDKPRAQFRKKKKSKLCCRIQCVCVCVYTVFLYKWIILGKPCFLSRKSSFCSEYSTRKQKHPGSFFHLQFVEDSVSICSSTLNTWVLLGSAKVHIEICKWYI